MRRVPSRPSQGPRLVLRIHADVKPALSTDVFRPDDERPAAAFPRFRATVRAVNPRFIAVLLPLAAAATEPRVDFALKDGSRTARVQWPGHTDTFRWDGNDGSVKLLESR